MAKKIDGVIEAVHFKNGQIVQVRAYERRGFTYSDRVMLDRKTLTERLESGKRFVTGSRQNLMASTFTTGKPVFLTGEDGRSFVSTREGATADELEGVPVF